MRYKYLRYEGKLVLRVDEKRPYACDAWVQRRAGKCQWEKETREPCDMINDSMSISPSNARAAVIEQGGTAADVEG